MKALYLLLFMITAATVTAHAQERTRDQLFPDFQKDIAKQQTAAATTADPRKTASSTRSLLFTNYQQPRSSNNTGSRLNRRPVSANGKPQPSEISVTEARKAIKPVKIEKTPIQQQQ